MAAPYSGSQTPAGQFLSEATTSGDLKARSVDILYSPAKTIKYDPLEAALELYALKPDGKAKPSSQKNHH